MAEFLFLGANGSLQDPDSGNTSLLICGSEGRVCVDLSCNIATVTDKSVDTVILTHEHIDHVYALPSLLHQSWLSGRTKPMRIVVPAGLEGIPETMMDLFRIREKKGMFSISVSSETDFTVGSLHLSLFQTDHTDTSVGVVAEERGKKLVYTCDTRPVTAIPELLREADVLIHEASGLENNEVVLVKKGHSSAADAARLADELGVKSLYLCHLPRGVEAKSLILSEAGKIFPSSFIPEILRSYCI